MEPAGNSSRQSNSQGSSCLFTKCFPPLKFRKEYLKEIGDGEIAGVVRKIISEARTSDMDLSDIAFHPYQIIPKGSLEGTYQDLCKVFVVEPLCQLLRTALNLSLIVRIGRPTTWDVQKDGEGKSCVTDLAICNGNFVYCVIEVKKYPLHEFGTHLEGMLTRNRD